MILQRVLYLTYGGEYLKVFCIAQILTTVSRNAGGLILHVTYGYTVSQENDRFVNQIEELLLCSGAARQKGPFLVDALPFCERYIDL